MLLASPSSSAASRVCQDCRSARVSRCLHTGSSWTESRTADGFNSVVVVIGRGIMIVVVVVVVAAAAAAIIIIIIIIIIIDSSGGVVVLAFA